jgi:hypothetical protein
MKNAEKFIQQEMQKRLDLVNDENFRIKSIEVAKKLGITADEWNKNKAIILMYFANEFCTIANKIN